MKGIATNNLCDQIGDCPTYKYIYVLSFKVCFLIFGLITSSSNYAHAAALAAALQYIAERD